MLKITPAPQSVSQIEVSAADQRKIVSESQLCTSSISYAKSKSTGIWRVFSSCFTWIASLCGKILTGIKDALLKWTCLGECYKEEEKQEVAKETDWAQVKETFTGIKEAVFPVTPESKKDGKGRQTRFNEFYKDLPGPAKDLFHKQIALALARHIVGDNGEAQEQYATKNWTDISKEFQRILSSVADPQSKESCWELKEAVLSFEKELQKR
jgi:hypothetical protein